MVDGWSVEPLSGSGHRVVVTGEFDLALEEMFVVAVAQLLDDGAPRVQIDLHGVEFIDPSGVRALLRLRVHHPGRVTVSRASDAVRRVLDIAGVTTGDVHEGWIR